MGSITTSLNVPRFRRYSQGPSCTVGHFRARSFSVRIPPSCAQQICCANTKLRGSDAPKTSTDSANCYRVLFCTLVRLIACLGIHPTMSWWTLLTCYIPLSFTRTIDGASRIAPYGVMAGLQAQHVPAQSIPPARDEDCEIDIPTVEGTAATGVPRTRVTLHSETF